MGQTTIADRGRFQRGLYWLIPIYSLPVVVYLVLRLMELTGVLSLDLQKTFVLPWQQRQLVFAALRAVGFAQFQLLLVWAFGAADPRRRYLAFALTFIQLGLLYFGHRDHLRLTAMILPILFMTGIFFWGVGTYAHYAWTINDAFLPRRRNAELSFDIKQVLIVTALLSCIFVGAKALLPRAALSYYFSRSQVYEGAAWGIASGVLGLSIIFAVFRRDMTVLSRFLYIGIGLAVALDMRNSRIWWREAFYVNVFVMAATTLLLCLPLRLLGLSYSMSATNLLFRRHRLQYFGGFGFIRTLWLHIDASVWVTLVILLPLGFSWKFVWSVFFE